MNQPNILGIVGSIRSNHKHIKKLENYILSSQTEEELKNKILASSYIFSNSDIAIAFALLGAQKYGAHISLYCISSLFQHKKMDIYTDLLSYDTIDDINNFDSLNINEFLLKQLLQNLKKIDGIILGTPVYFGDRSSIANKFLQITQKYKSLYNKAFGVVSVGAKRNGGQETTNIYTLQEAMAQGAIVVGNGPKTSQYGGTVWAGDTGDAINDHFGLETSFGTGRQVAQLSDIIKKGKEYHKMDKSIKITFILTMDTHDKYFEKLLHTYTETLSNSKVETIVYNLTDYTIYRCIACNLCPSPKMIEKTQGKKFPYHCIVQTPKDDMKQVQSLLVSSDAIVLVGVNSHQNLIYRYQAFMERTRFIRHDDFELTNIPTIGMLFNELGATNNQIFNLKILTSFIRHNTFFLKPLEVFLKNGKIIYQDDINDYIAQLKQIKMGRELIPGIEISYKATGYKYKDLDHTTKIRK